MKPQSFEPPPFPPANSLPLASHLRPRGLKPRDSSREAQVASSLVTARLAVVLVRAVMMAPLRLPQTHQKYSSSPASGYGGQLLLALELGARALVVVMRRPTGEAPADSSTVPG